MVASAAGVAVCAVAGLLLRRRPDLSVLVYLALWVLLPHAAVREAPITLGIHPATIFILFALALTLLTGPAQVLLSWRRSVESSLGIYAALFVFLCLACLTQVTAEDMTLGAGLALEQIVAPLAAFTLAGCALAHGTPLRRRVLFLIIYLALFESLLSFAQLAWKEYFPYEAYFRLQYWYTPGVWTRYGGTLDHPLVLGLLLAVAIWSLWIVRPVLLRLSLAVIFLGGIGVTQSRTALVAGVLGTLVLLATSRMTSLQRLASFTIIAAATLTAWQLLVNTDAVQRLIADGGSAAGRQVAYEIFFDHATNFLIYGDGAASSWDFAFRNGSPLSFENPFMLYTVDFGLPAAMLYFGTQIFLIVRALTTADQRLVGLTAAVAFGMTQSFSSLETQSASAALLWLTLALVAMRGSVSDRVTPPSPPHTPPPAVDPDEQTLGVSRAPRGSTRVR